MAAHGAGRRRRPLCGRRAVARRGARRYAAAVSEIAKPALSSNLRGALWMLASAITFSVMTTLIKYLGNDYPAALQTFYRQAAGLVVLLPVIMRHRSAAFATTRPGILIFRSLTGTVGMILSFYAFQKM